MLIILILLISINISVSNIYHKQFAVEVSNKISNSKIKTMLSIFIFEVPSKYLLVLVTLEWFKVEIFST